MIKIILLLYLFSAVNCLAISWLIYKTKNGWLRKLMLFYFSAASLALIVRLCSWYFNWEGQIVTVVVMIPVSLALFALTLFLYDNYK